jgi:hypothetical protein
MKELNRLVAVLAGAVVVTGALGIAAIGCGSTSTSSPEDGGVPDSASDSTMGLTPEGGEGVDSAADSASEGGGATDSTADVVVQADVVQEAAADAVSESVADADTGVADSGILPNAETFPSLLATAFCDTIATCCGTSADAASFNWQTCFNTVSSSGFKGINTTGTNLVDGGHIDFNLAQAQTCLKTIGSADCTSNQISSTEESLLFQNCYGAYNGTLAAGSPCAGTLECAPGNFCLPVDGGVGDAGAIGQCQPLAGAGGACGLFGAQGLGQTVCSYRGSASNGLFCQNISGDAGTTQLSPAQWTCQPQWANGSDCYANQDCTSSLCVEVGSSNAFQCGSAGDWAYPNTCALFVVPVDAGGD